MDIKKYKELSNKEYEKNGKSELFIKAQNAIIATKNAEWIYKFAKDVNGADIELLQDAIIKTNDEVWICRFALSIKGANKAELSKVIAKIGCIDTIYSIMMKGFEDMDILLLQDALIQDAYKNGDIIKHPEKCAEYIYDIAVRVDGVDITKLENTIIETGNAEYIYKFARDVKGAGIPKLENAIIKTGRAFYIYKFAKDVKGADIPKLEDGIIATKNAEYIYEFAKNVKRANLAKLQDAIVSSKNAEYMYEFARHFKGADIDRLCKAIANTHDTYIMSRLAEDVNIGVNNIRLFQKNFKDIPSRIYKFAEICIKKGVDIDDLMPAIIYTGNIEYINKMFELGNVTCGKVEQALIKLKNVTAIYNYGIYYKVESAASIKKLQQIIMDNGTDKCIIKFANDVAWANIKMMEDIIIARRDTFLIYKFANDVVGSNKNKLNNALKDIMAKRETLEGLVEDVESGFLQ